MGIQSFLPAVKEYCRSSLGTLDYVDEVAYFLFEKAEAGAQGGST
jgi:hypothetical protein